MACATSSSIRMAVSGMAHHPTIRSATSTSLTGNAARLRSSRLPRHGRDEPGHDESELAMLVMKARQIIGGNAMRSLFAFSLVLLGSVALAPSFADAATIAGT